AQAIYQFPIIDNAYESRRSGRHDLLARECGASTLDEVTGARCLIGTIDIELQAVDVVQVEHLDAERLQARRRCVGARDRSPDAFTAAAEGIDEVVNGRASAHANDGIALEPATEKMVYSGSRCSLLLCVTV